MHELPAGRYTGIFTTSQMYDCLLQELLLRYKEKVEELLTIKGFPLIKIRHLITGLLVSLENDADYRASMEVFLNADKTEESSRVLKGSGIIRSCSKIGWQA